MHSRQRYALDATLDALRSRFRALVSGRLRGAMPVDLRPAVTAADADAVWASLLALRDEAAPRLPAVDADDVLLGYAPCALLDGCWLAGAVGVRGSHTELGAALLEAFFLETGEGDAARHHGNLYRAVLAARGLALPAVGSEAFVADARLDDASFALALPALELAGAPPEALDAVVGHHLAASLLSPPQLVLQAAGELSGSRYFAEHAPGNRAETLARRVLEAWCRAPSRDATLLWHGIHAYVEARRAWLASRRPRCAPEPWAAMLGLVARKARHARGFHRGVVLGERSLEAWFASEPFEARDFLHALARSPWIVQGCPGESPLLTRSVRFGGPMFGVFGDDELDVVRAWVAALADAPEPPIAESPALRRPVELEPAPPADLAARRPAEPRQARSPATRLAARRSRRPQHAPSPAATASVRLSLPELYHRLLAPEHHADAGALAHTHVERVLAAARRATTPRRLAARGLWPWQSGCLEHWLDSRLAEQIGADRDAPDASSLAATLTHEEVVFLLTQLAPAALVDGAWLQGMTAPVMSHLPVATRLLRIYRDELGAGEPVQHHGNVMRRVLAAQGVTLEAPESRAFVERRDLLPAAFSTPALWLAIAHDAEAWLPELLGLNLAIEMAGLGTTYTLAAALLRRHGIDPLFFELHNTIDNAASGHTAWSTEAITTWLDAIEDPEARARAWQRIWHGHAAYEQSSRPLVRALALRLGPRVGWRWLRRRVGLGPGSP